MKLLGLLYAARCGGPIQRICAVTALCCFGLFGPSASAERFDPAAFKAEVAKKYGDSGAPVLVEELAKTFEALKLNVTRDQSSVRAFYAGLISQIGPDSPQKAESERAYLEVVSRFLAGRDVWSTTNTDEATDRLGQISKALGQSTQQADATLVAIVDDAISKADNMYIAALRQYDPRSEAMRTLIEKKLIPLLDVDYVMASRHSVSIRAAIAAKYMELALLEANYDEPICSDAANLKKDTLDLSAKFARDLLQNIEAGKAPPSAAAITNDLFYHLQQVAALSCDHAALAQYGGRLIKLQPSTIGDEELRDQVYVFRHLRTKRTMTSDLVTVDTDNGEKQATEYKPDQSDVLRSFFNPWQLSMYLCKTVRGSEELSVNQLKAKLGAFENVDFRVNVVVAAKTGASMEDLARALDKRRTEILNGIKRKLTGDMFGTGATHKTLMAGAGDECGQFLAFPPDARVDSVISANSFRMVETTDGEFTSRFRIGGSFSFAEAKAVRDTLREVFRDWSVTLGRPRIQD